MTDNQRVRCPVQSWAAQYPEHIALHGTNPLSYQQLDHRLHSLCQQLQQAGLKRGDHLLALMRSSQDEVLVLWACVRLGIVLCPINPAFPLAKVQQLAQLLDADAYWVANGELALDLPHVFLDTQRELASDDPCWLRPAQLNNMILTSGSSGTPKAVVHRLRNHLASAQGSAALIPLSLDSGWLLSLPLFHVGGYAIVFRVFLAGARLILDDKSQPLKARLYRDPISHLSLVPTQLWRLLADGFTPEKSQLRELLLGGAAIPAPLVNAISKLGLQPKVSYGLSEMSSQVCTASPRDSGQVGKPLTGREVCVKEQEICVRGETLFAGYYRQGKLDLPLDEDGWFHTRDKGFIDEQGQLVVLGRLDNLFISGGENIQPETIEQQLVNHPAISQALVVPIASDEWGARPVAFIEWHAEPQPWSILASWLRDRLPGFMVPDHWLSWPIEQQGLKPSRQLFAAQARQLITAQTDSPPSL